MTEQRKNRNKVNSRKTWKVGASLWLAWFLLLTATPYHLSQPYRGPVLTGFYGWVALGLLLGCALAYYGRFVGRQTGSSSSVVAGFYSSRAFRVLCIVGFLVAVFVCGIEWITLPISYQGNPELVFSHRFLSFDQVSNLFPLFEGFSTWRTAIEDVGGVCLMASGALCSLCLASFALPYEISSNCPSPVLQSCFRLGRGRLKSLARLEELPSILATCSLLAVLALGFLNPMVDYWSFHSETACVVHGLQNNSAAFAQWATKMPEPSVMLPRIAALLLALLCVGCGFANRLCSADGAPGIRQACGGADAPIALLAFFCLGTLAWNFLSRSTKHLYLSLPQEIWWGSVVLEIVLLVVFAALLFLLTWARARRKVELLAMSERSGAEIYSKDEDPDNGARFRKTMEGVFGIEWLARLSERELESVKYSLSGLSSTDSALQMGLKAPTVRAYLQRAYKKLEVEDGDELKRLVGSIEAEEHCGSVLGEGRTKGVLISLARWAACLALPLVLTLAGSLPYGAEVGKVLPFGCGTGFMLAAVFLWGREPLGLPTLRRALAILVGTLAFVICFFGAVCFESSETLLDCGLFLLGSVGAFLSAVGLMALPKRPVGDCCVYGKDDRTALLLMAVSGGVGLACQVQWLLPDAPVSMMMAPACIILVATLACVAIERNIVKAVVAAATVLALWMGESGASIALFLMLLLLVKMLFLPQWQSGALLCLGAGMSIGRLATNVVNDLTKTGSWVFDHADPDDPLFLMIGFGVSVAVLIVVGWVCYSFWRSMRSETNVWEWRRACALPADQMLDAYFRSRGLNETQSKIAAKLAQGLTAPEISAACFVSLSSVDQARTIAYRLMKVRSQDAFIEAVKRCLPDIAPGR